MTHVPTAAELSRREVAFRDAVADAERHAVRRMETVGGLLGLDERACHALAEAGLEVARQFAAEVTYANYEHRTGMPWPDEGRAMADEERAGAWKVALDRLGSAAGPA